MAASPNGTGGAPNWWDEIKHETSVYFDHVLGLVPGKSIRSFSADQTTAGDMADWTADDKLLLIEQGRIQLARQRQDLENIRQRAQFLFTTTLGAIGLATLGFEKLATQIGPLLLWSLGMLILTIALLGTAAVVVAKKELREIHTSILSMQRSPLHDSLAPAYATSMSQGENTVATQITVFRDAVFFLILGLLLVASSWIVLVSFGHSPR